MSIITYQVTPSVRYFERKRKDDIIRWIEDLTKRRLSTAEFNDYRKRTNHDLAREAMAAINEQPD